MRCDAVQQLLSLAADAEPAEPGGAPVAVDTVVGHLGDCVDCSAFQRDLTDLRRLLRFEPVDDIHDPPDVAPAVMAALASRPRRSRPAWWSVAAAVVVGMVAGAVFVGVGSTPDAPAEAEIPARVLDAQRDITSLQATVELVVRQNGADPPEQRLRGELAYRAPDTLSVVLRDVGAGGSRHVLVVDETRWWAEGPRRCTPPSVASCSSVTSTRAIVDRAPFAAVAPAPLDVVAPVRSFALSAPPVDLGRRRIAGRDAIGVRVTAAQVAPVLAGFDPTGALRQLHPSDPTEIWLDAEHLVPLAVTVRVGHADERTRWAAARGYADEPGVDIVELVLDDVQINRAVPDSAFPPPPTGVRLVSGGFTDTESDSLHVPRPAYVPTGAQPYREGQERSPTGPAVDVLTWSDGRAWLAIRATPAWPGGRLFGDLGDLVRVVDLGEAGVGYVGEDGSVVGVHTDGLDLVVSGSYADDELLRVAGSLDIRGVPVPGDWAESSATATDDPAIGHRVLLPQRLDGFGPPSIRVDGGTVTAAATGAGGRGFVMSATPGAALPPPIDPDVVSVAVRSTIGRYSPGRGDLEWVEEGMVYSLRSTGLGVNDLIAVADRLGRTR